MEQEMFTHYNFLNKRARNTPVDIIITSFCDKIEEVSEY